WFAVVALLVGSIGFGLRPSADAAPAAQTNNTDRHDRNPFERISVTGNILTGGTFSGDMDIVNFYTEGDQVFANGILEGTLRDVNGRRIGSVEDVFASGFPVNLGQSGQASAAA